MSLSFYINLSLFFIIYCLWKIYLCFHQTSHHFSFSCSQHSNSLPHIDSVVNIAAGLGFTESGQSETLLLLRSLSEKHINDLQYNLNVAHSTGTDCHYWAKKRQKRVFEACICVVTFYNSHFEKGKVTKCSYQGKNIFETFRHRYIFSYKHLLRCIPY